MKRQEAFRFHYGANKFLEEIKKTISFPSSQIQRHKKDTMDFLAMIKGSDFLALTEP